MFEYYDKAKVLVTGGTGMIGRALVDLLIKHGAEVKVVSVDTPLGLPIEVKYHYSDLRNFVNCMSLCKDQDIVFHLAGVKGSPAMTLKKPASFFVNTLMFNTNMMEAARRCDVERFLYTSTVGVYGPSEVFVESETWDKMPSNNDWFAGWAKRMGELQADAYKIEYGWNGVSIVRPANVYGPYDNFDPNNAMVIPSLIRRIIDGENPLIVWGDGSPIRDFIYAEDVAKGMMMAIEQNVSGPLNLGSGRGVTIKELVDTLVDLSDEKPQIEWDSSKPSGDKKRLMNIDEARRLLGWEPVTTISSGLLGTYQWYKHNKDRAITGRYNAFTEQR